LTCILALDNFINVILKNYVTACDYLSACALLGIDE